MHAAMKGTEAADRRLVLASAWLRTMATGLVGVLLGVHLAKSGLDAAQIGAVVGAGLAGAAVAGGLTSWWGDRLGRRRMLVILALLAALGCGVVAFAGHPWILGAAAFLGMLNGMGREGGASGILDQAILPMAAEGHGRTLAFAHYNFLKEAGAALGVALAGLPWVLQRMSGIREVHALRITWGIPILFTSGAALLCLRLSPQVEAASSRTRPPLSAAGKALVQRVAPLFFVDAFADGLLPSTLLAYFLYRRFGVSEGSLALLFFAGRVANALSNYGAAWLSRRVGLVNTMVFTHLPSSLLLLGMAIAPGFPVAAILFLARESLVEMDVPTRQSYLMAIVSPGECTAVAGATQMVRMAGWAVAPALAGLLMNRTSLATPLLIGAGLKILYDGLLFVSFRRVRPPEEVGFQHA